VNRRNFIKFMGRGFALPVITGSASLIGACSTLQTKTYESEISGLKPSNKDQLELLSGLNYHVVVKWQDIINSQGDFFGYNCDFLTVLPGESANHCFLWANHETANPLFTSGFNPEKNIGLRKTRAQCLIEQKNVGGSFISLNRTHGKWSMVTRGDRAFRVDGTTNIPLIADRPILGESIAVGTLGNCSGGLTPWGTILSCEENFQDFYGQTKYLTTAKSPKRKRRVIASSSNMAWDDHFTHPPEHFGWVVEIDPTTKKAKKLVALGRFAHEGALVLKASDGRCVVYMGDDARGEHFYKFISEQPGSLERGQLFVANINTGRWEHLSINNPILAAKFIDQTDILIRTREAAKLLGATPMDRPEGCAQDPVTQAIYFACTMNKEEGRPFGSIMKLVEKNNDLLSINFTCDSFSVGGDKTDFSCPDNICFDKNGNLWMTTDIADYDLNLGEYERFGNNSLFYIPMQGKNAGRAFRVANAPREAEFTGPCFSLDNSTLFLSVQHPGATTKDLMNPTSSWPDGPGTLPRSSVVAISGPLLQQLLLNN
jgi:secreted PhoX family phosphatase